MRTGLNSDPDALDAGRDSVLAGGGEDAPSVSGAQGAANVYLPDPAVVHAVRALLAVPQLLSANPEEHPRVDAKIEELARLFGRVVSGQTEPFTLTVSECAVSINGRSWSGMPHLTVPLAFFLRRRRIRSLTIHPGLTGPETDSLVKFVLTEHEGLLKDGGVMRVLPNVAVDMLAESDLPVDRIAALEECLCASEAVASIERLRQAFAEAAGGGEAFDQTVSDFLNRSEWAGMDPERIRAAFYAFLARLLEIVQAGDTADARVEGLSLVRDVSPELLLEQVPSKEEEIEEVAPHSGATGIDPQRHQSYSADGAAAQTIRRELELHDPHENALMILCDLLVGAENRHEYQKRRDVFLTAFDDRRYSSSALARILRYIAMDLPSQRFESRDAIIGEVFDCAIDDEALVLFLSSVTKQPDVARPILGRLAMRPNPFPLLVRLITAPQLEAFRNALASKLVDAARLKRDALARWARTNRDAFFLPDVFEPLFLQGTDLLGAICKEILTEGSRQDRSTLIDRLRTEGTESALRLLVLGLPYGGAPCDLELIEALSDFQHPLALAALREVVHRNNVRDARIQEVRCAFEAIASLGLEAGWSFLWEIVQRRWCFMMPFYRIELRRVAMELLERERRK